MGSASVACYQNKWKLVDIGGSTLMSSAISGVLRRSIPPESVVSYQITSNLKSQSNDGRFLVEGAQEV